MVNKGLDIYDVIGIGGMILVCWQLNSVNQHYMWAFIGLILVLIGTVGGGFKKR